MEKEENLKDWLERTIEQSMREAGFTRQMTPTQKTQKEQAPISGTITFVKKTNNNTQNEKDEN